MAIAIWYLLSLDQFIIEIPCTVLLICQNVFSIFLTGAYYLCISRTRDIKKKTEKIASVIQLDCMSVRSWEPNHNFACRGPISNPRPVLDSSAKTTRVNVLDFFVKPKKRSRLTSFRVFHFLLVFHI